MLQKLNKDLKYILFLLGISFFAIIIVYGHQGHLIIDCGREVYIPNQMILGKILYKDIFNIYGPFSYMFNAGLFNTFGNNLNVLYLMGCLCSFAIVTLIYSIARRFLPEFLSFAIAFFTIAVGILPINLFNFIFPYSFGMLYGVVAFLVSVWFLLKYEKNLDTIYFYTSCLFAGLCVASKYDFIPFLIVILYAAIKIKKLSFKEYYYTFFTLFCIPAFCFGVLFFQGLTIHELLQSFKMLNVMAHTDTLKYFYQTQGVYFHHKTLGFLLINFLKTVIPFVFLLFGLKSIKKITSIAIVLISVFLMLIWVTPVTFAFLPLLIVFLALFSCKYFNKNVSLTILTLSAITFSLKSFWGLATLNYGVFFVSFLLITTIVLFANLFNHTPHRIPLQQGVMEKLYNSIGIYIVIIALILGYRNLFLLKVNNELISFKQGHIYTNSQLYSSTQDLIGFINKNTKKTDRIVILPEGAMINYITQRPSDDYYTSLIPLYVETFGENNIIKHFQKTKPEYIIFNNWDTSNYYFHYICNDYALGFCSFVATNYTQEKVIDNNNFRYLIFKRKD